MGDGVRRGNKKAKLMMVRYTKSLLLQQKRKVNQAKPKIQT